MYLSARKYVSDYNYEEGKNREQVANILEAIGLDRDALSTEAPSVRVEVNIAYWRKANAIHKWFVDNLAGGEDDCKPVYVNRKDLQSLLDTLEEALKARRDIEQPEYQGDIATPTLEDSLEDILPTEGGFFFGSTAYDEWYWIQLEWTHKRLTEILNDERFEGFDFEYNASW